MIETISVDRQLADMLWMAATALRAGYPTQQVFGQLASLAPEPCATVCARLSGDLGNGLSLVQAFERWQQVEPSPFLPEIIAALREHDAEDSELATRLAALSKKLLETAGTDPAFYPAMRELAHAVGAGVPSRARENR